MKKLLSLLCLTVVLFTACTSEEGPPGPPGPPGENGLDRLGYTFEETVNFDYFADVNLYSALITIPDNIATLEPEADAVLVYRLEIIEAQDGSAMDSWSLVPQNFFLSEGTIQYVYNHTVNDVEILIDGNFDLSNLDNDFIDNQTFRIVVVPSDFATKSGVNTSDLEAVMSALNIQKEDIQHLDNL